MEIEVGKINRECLSILNSNRYNDFMIKKVIKPEQMYQYIEEQPSIERLGIQNNRKSMLLVLQSLQFKELECFCIIYGSEVNQKYIAEIQIRILGKFDEHDYSITIDSQNKVDGDDYLSQNYIIVDPGNLYSPSQITQQFGCSRKSRLSQQYELDQDYSIHTFIGHVVHEMFQYFITNPDIIPSIFQFKKVFIDIVRLYQQEVYFLGIDEHGFYNQHIQPYQKIIHSFVNKYIRNKETIKLKNSEIVINKIHSIEEPYNSQIFQMKGFIDIIVLADYVVNGEQFENVPMIIELKTGKAQSFSHNAQVLMYQLMLVENYNIRHSYLGLLFYLKLDEFQLIQLDQKLVSDLLFKKNKIAIQFLNQKQELPEPINQISFCNICDYQDICTFKLAVDVQDCRKYMTKYVVQDLEIYKEHEQMARQKQIVEYVNRWESILRIENDFIQQQQNRYKDLKFRLKYQLQNEMEFEYRDSNKQIVYDVYGFYKTNEIVILQSENRDVKIKGSINSVYRTKQILEEIKWYILEVKVMVIYQDQKYSQQQMKQDFRLNKFNSHGFNQMNYNLYKLIRNRRQVEYLVLGRMPVYGDQRLMKKDIEETIGVEGLNDMQIDGIVKSVCTDSYHLILGMPGTGKTHMIVRLVEYLVRKDKKILLTAYTHSALDNIINKLDYQQMKDKLIKLQSMTSIQQNVLSQNSNSSQYCYDNRKNWKLSHKQYKQKMDQLRVFCGSIRNMNNVVLNNIDFDYTIIDEASLCFEPIILNPILKAKKFLLIGDYYQLQPLVKCQKAQNEGLGISLFERLCQKEGNRTDLNIQFRMNEEIMNISNVLVYEGRLKCGSKEIGGQRLELEKGKKVDKLYKEIIREENPVVFVNMDKISGNDYVKETLEKKKKKKKIDMNGFMNQVGLKVVVKIVEQLQNVGVMDIGVLCLYKEFKYKMSKELGSDVMTIDQSQGIDKDCIVIYMMFNQKDNMIENWRRINVAFTRGKKKLIIVGSIGQFQSYSKYDGIVEQLQEYMVDLQVGHLK